MKKNLVVMLLFFSVSFALFGCKATQKVEEIKVEASSEANSIDKRSEELKKEPLKEPSEALAKKRREALLKSFETKEGCPNCQNKAVCETCSDETCLIGDGCKECKEGKLCLLEQS